MSRNIFEIGAGEICHLILDQIDSLKDLCSFCLTSRACFAMTVSHLYKVVPLAARPTEFMDSTPPLIFAHSLSSRLLDSKNEVLRRAVHELDFGLFSPEDIDDMETRLLSLVDSLPNLQRVKIRGRLTPKALETLAGHQKRISLFLLGEDGQRQVEDHMQMRNVVALAATVNPYDRTNGPNRRVLGVQKLLFACPALLSFSLEFAPDLSSDMGIPEVVPTLSFSLANTKATFPPLEELSLIGYQMSQDEAEHWKKKFQWSSLKSLTLGPPNMVAFLSQTTGCALSLKTLEVKRWLDEETRSDCPSLQCFLMAFTTLESLVVKGYHVPLEAVANHRSLKCLCIHSFEPVHSVSTAYLRPTYGVEQLKELDERCPHLEELELDSNSREEAARVLESITQKFRNLRRLTVHLALDLRGKAANAIPPKVPDSNAYVNPVLTEDYAREIGQPFFACRRQRLPSSRLGLLVLKTGEPLRTLSDYESINMAYERKYTDTIEVRRPLDIERTPDVVTLARDPWSCF